MINLKDEHIKSPGKPPAKSTPIGFADPGLLAAEHARQDILNAPYIHLTGQMKNFQTEKEKPTQEELLYPYLSVFNPPKEIKRPTDWKGMYAN